MSSLNCILKCILLYIIHYYLNSDNSIVKTIAKSAKCSSVTVSHFGDNYRYFSYKYKIENHVWGSPLCKVHKCFDLPFIYVS